MLYICFLYLFDMQNSGVAGSSWAGGHHGGHRQKWGGTQKSVIYRGVHVHICVREAFLQGVGDGAEGACPENCVYCPDF